MRSGFVFSTCRGEGYVIPGKRFIIIFPDEFCCKAGFFQVLENRNESMGNIPCSGNLMSINHNREMRDCK